MVSPSEIEEILSYRPLQPLRVVLTSGDEMIVREQDKPFISGLCLVLRGVALREEILARSRLLSIPNIALIEPVPPRQGGRRTR